MNRAYSHPGSPTFVIPKIGHDERRVSLAEFNGHPYVDLRIHFRDAESGEMRPSRKGVTISPAYRPRFRQGLVQLDGALRAHGLIEDEGSG